MSIQALREHKLELSRLANELLSNKGSQIWSKDDQATFDGHMDEAERVDSQITAHQRALDLRAEKHFTDAVKIDATGEQTEKQKGVEAFTRKAFKDMTPEEVGSVRNAMSTTTGSQGGYTVQTDIARQFVDQLRDYGGMRRVSDRIVTAMGNPLSFPTTDGRAEIGELVQQNVAASSSDATFGTVPVNTFKFSSKIITVPIELLQDSEIDIVALVQKRMRDRIGRIHNLKFTQGAGTTEPTGLVTAASVGVIGTTGETLTVGFDDLTKLVDTVDYAYQSEGGMTWMMAQSLRSAVRRIKDTNGRPIFVPGYGSITEGFTDFLLGHEININNDMPVPAANAKSLSFGQHKKYLIRDAMEVTLFRFDDSYYMSNGQVGFLAWARAGGNLLDTASVSLFQHSAT